MCVRACVCQYTWCSQVFTEPLDLLAVLFSQALEAMDPPLSRTLQAAMQGKNESLLTLTDARQVHAYVFIPLGYKCNYNISLSLSVY